MNKISIIGTGYVGLVTGVGMAEFGNQVICTDIDKTKIDNLNSGLLPIYEPGLEEIIKRNVKYNRLSFSPNVIESIAESDVIVIAVGTPQGENGKADMSFVLSVAETISNNLNSYKIIVTKSTVPIGSGKRIIDIINAHVCPELEESDRLLLQAAKLTEILEVAIRDFYYEQGVSGEIAWQLIQGLSDVRLERLKGKSSSE